VAARNKILQAFEQAEAEEDPRLHRDLLTFVLVGGGPTGVEMAGAIASRSGPWSNPNFAGLIPHWRGLCW